MRILIVDKSYVFAEGLKSVLSDLPVKPILLSTQVLTDIDKQIKNFLPDILFIDYGDPLIGVLHLKKLRQKFLPVKFIAITEEKNRETFLEAMRSGIDSHLLKCCSKEEILEAVETVKKGKRFYCGQIIQLLEQNTTGDINCQGFSLSAREIEIIRLIAEGYTNKEIADQLCLSIHTVNTHRKNIMQKLGIKNTAGIVIYAVKENIIEH